MREGGRLTARVVLAGTPVVVAPIREYMSAVIITLLGLIRQMSDI